ncbi:DNA polymerase III subunit gamma/tau [Pigmentiphaga litoralis]|uniref:DNA polymerase III subunit gamma/tau n=1 Tax=Pigmentiphaga litoralis TaxID=516702 RepID=UPI003B4336DD
MTYLVLARKWRPRSFETLVGQEHVVRALSHALTTQRLHHAWLFTGTRGVGKTTLSRILAKSLNCETGITPTPCGVCRACTEIDAGRFVDYLELDAASNRGVDEMTQLLEQAVYSPTSGRFKVYMIDEVHMLTGHAFNAMLKTLEEPPPHVKFILATTDPQKIPVTVLSRCLQFNLKQMPPEAIVGHLDHVLQQEQMPFETGALRLIGQAARGSMRDALSLTDQAIAYSAGNLSEEAVRGMLGTIDQRHLVRLLDAVASADGPGVVAVADELSLRSLSYAGALADLAVLLSRVALAQRVAGTVPDEDPLAADIGRLATTLSPDHVQLFYSVAVHSRAELPLAPDEYAGFVMACLRMLAFTAEPGDTPPPMATPSKPAATRAAPLRSPSPVAATSAPVTPRSGAAGAPAAGTAAAAPATASVAGTTPAASVAGAASAPLAAGTMPASPAVAESAGDASSGAASAAAAPVPETAAPAPAAAPAKLSPSAMALQAANAALQRSAGPGSARGASSRAGAAAAKPAERGAAPVATATQVNATAAESAPAETATAVRSAPAAMATAVEPAPVAKPLDVDAVLKAPAAAVRPVPADAPESAAEPAVSADSRQADSRLAAPRQAEPRQAEPRQAHPKQADPRQADPKPAQPTFADPTLPPARQISDMDAFEAYASQGPDDDFDGYTGAPPDDGYDDYPTTGNTAGKTAGKTSGKTSGKTTATRPAGARGTPARGAAPAAPAAAPAVDRSAVFDSPQATGDDADAPAGTITLTESWATLAARLPLRGLAAQLAQQSEWVGVDGATIVLRVATRTLSEGAGVERLRVVLEAHFGTTVRLRFEIGKTGDNTAYAAAVSERQARQEAAEQTIMADPFVRDLLDQFGGKIVPDSIRPVTPDTQQGTPS